MTRLKIVPILFVYTVPSSANFSNLYRHLSSGVLHKKKTLQKLPLLLVNVVSNIVDQVVVVDANFLWLVLELFHELLVKGS